MKLTLALPALVALAVPASASTLTHGFDIRVTPQYLTAYDDWIGEKVFAVGDPEIGSRICEDSGSGDGSVRCRIGGDMSHDLVRLNDLYASTLGSNVQITPVTGRISFDGTGHVACTGELGRIIWSCGRTGGAGPWPDYIPPQQWTMRAGATATSFSLSATDGMGGFSESVSLSGGYMDVDSSASLSFEGASFQTIYPGYRLSYGVEILLDITQPGNLPSPVPLPASLPLLAGALAAAGAIGRHKRRVSRR